MAGRSHPIRYGLRNTPLAHGEVLANLLERISKVGGTSVECGPVIRIDMREKRTIYQATGIKLSDLRESMIKFERLEMTTGPFGIDGFKHFGSNSIRLRKI